MICLTMTFFTKLTKLFSSEGDSDIRAQFFAQLASSLTEKDNKTSAATSGDDVDDDHVDDDGQNHDHDEDEDDVKSLIENEN